MNNSDIVSVIGWTNAEKLQLLHQLWNAQIVAASFQGCGPSWDSDVAEKALQGHSIDYLCGRAFKILPTDDEWDLSLYNRDIQRQSQLGQATYARVVTEITAARAGK